MQIHFSFDEQSLNALTNIARVSGNHEHSHTAGERRIDVSIYLRKHIGQKQWN